MLTNWHLIFTGVYFVHEYEIFEYIIRNLLVLIASDNFGAETRRWSEVLS
jgi:hypothetical protein